MLLLNKKEDREVFDLLKFCAHSPLHRAFFCSFSLSGKLFLLKKELGTSKVFLFSRSEKFNNFLHIPFYECKRRKT